MEQGLISYIHDDSEQLLDNFTVIVNSTELWKQSLPHTIFVTVRPINDESPVIRRNKVLRVSKFKISICNGIICDCI